jgi:hypothetical protein
MERSISLRRLSAAAGTLLACAALSACSGGGSGGGVPSSPGGSGVTPTATPTGAGSGSTPTPTPAPGTGSGSGSSTPTPAPATTPTPAGASTPTSAPASTPTPAPASSAISSLSSLTVGPTSISGNLGQTAAIGILDPSYTGPISVTATGNTLLGDVLSSLSSIQTGVLEGLPGTSDVFDVNLAGLLNLGALGASGSVLNVCETAKSPPLCIPVTLTSNPIASKIASNISDAVIVPGTFKVLTVASKLGVTNFTNFTVMASNSAISVQNLGNGNYDLGAAANLTTPASAIVTVNDGMGNSIAIPVVVL